MEPRKGTEFRSLRGQRGSTPNGTVLHFIVGVERYSSVSPKYKTLCGLVGNYLNDSHRIKKECPICFPAASKYERVIPEQETTKWTLELWNNKALEWFNIPTDKLTNWEWLKENFLGMNFNEDGSGKASEFINDMINPPTPKKSDDWLDIVKEFRMMGYDGDIRFIPSIHEIIDWLAIERQIDCVAMPNYNSEGRIYFGMIASFDKNVNKVIYLDDNEFKTTFNKMGLEAYTIFKNREDALIACLNYVLKNFK